MNLANKIDEVLTSRRLLKPPSARSPFNNPPQTPNLWPVRAVQTNHTKIKQNKTFHIEQINKITPIKKYS